MSLKFKEYITEAIGIETVKKALVGKPIWDYKTQLTEEFGGKYRKIIGRIEPNIRQDLEDHPLYNKLEKLFIDNGYILTKESYIDGYVTKGKQQFKIGKILQKWANKNETVDKDGVNDKDFFSSLLISFKDDPLRQTNRKPYLVVVSKHPYDVLGASTDRHWTSCVNLGGRIQIPSTVSAGDRTDKSKRGVNADILVDSLNEPYLVAYLVDPDDKNIQGKIMIQRPLMRILIYPFEGDRDPHIDDDSEFDYNWSIGEIYPQGAENEKFRTTVYDWVSGLNEKYKQSEKYRRISDVYYDSFDEELVRTYYDIEEIEDLFDTNANKNFLNYGSLEEIWEGSSSSFYIYDLKLENFIDKEYLNNEFTSDKKYNENFFIEMIKDLLRMSMFSRVYDDIDDLDIFRIYDETGTIHMDRIPINGLPHYLEEQYGSVEIIEEEYGPNGLFYVIFDYLTKYTFVDIKIDSSNLNTNLEMYFEQIIPLVSDKLLEMGVDPDPKNWKQIDEGEFREIHESIIEEFRM